MRRRSMIPQYLARHSSRANDSRSRLAKLKQREAKDISKRVKPLGRK